jgi:tape measure domain-containing protein
MSVTVDEIIQRYTLDDRASKGVRTLVTANDALASANSRANSGFAGLSGAASRFGSLASAAFSATTAAIVGATAAAVGFAAIAVNAAADMDSLKRALVATAGSAEEAERQFARLKEVAKLPGLGLKEAVQGSVRLQQAGFSANLAERALMAFGNSLALVGGGKAELDGVSMALTQIASKGKISAEEINQLAERVPQIRQAMIAAFGTADTEALQKRGIAATAFVESVVSQLEKVPRVSGGIRNALENFGDAAFQAFATIGSAIAKVLVPALDVVSSYFVFLVDSGVLDQVSRSMLSIFNLGGAGSSTALVHGLSWVVATLKNLPRIAADVGDYLSGAFKTVGENLSTAFKIGFGIFIGAQAVALISNVVQLAKAFMLVARAVQAWATAQGIATSLTGVGLAITAAAVAAGVGIYALTSKMFDGVASSIDAGVGNIKNLPAFQAIAKDQASLVAQFAGYQSKQADNASRSKVDGPTSPASMLSKIALATTKTAVNTEKALDLNRFALGGGDLSRAAVSPIELRRVRGGRRVDVRVTGADESLNRLFSDFLSRALPLYGGG